MAYPIVRIDPTTPTIGRSPALWRNALDKYDSDPLLGVLRATDFTKPHVGGIDAWSNGWWFSEMAAAGADTEVFATTNHPNGEFSLSAATDTDHEGVKMQAGPSATVGEGITLPTHATAALRRGDVIFEHRFYFNEDTQGTLVSGLFEQAAVAGVLGATSLLLDTVDYIGFYVTNGGDLQFVVRNDNAAGTAVEYNVDILSAAQLVVLEDTWLKLGFRVNRNNTVEIFVNGTAVRYSSEATPVKIKVPATALPEVDLSRTIGVARGIAGDHDPSTILTTFCDCYVEN